MKKPFIHLKSQQSRLHDSIQSKLGLLGLAIGCHQRSDRSMKIFGRQVPLCNRCLGVLVGIPLGLVVPATFSIASLLLVALPIDGFTQLSGIRTSTNTLRLATGVCFSVGAVNLLLNGVRLAIHNSVIR